MMTKGDLPLPLLKRQEWKGRGKVRRLGINTLDEKKKGFFWLG